MLVFSIVSFFVLPDGFAKAQHIQMATSHVVVMEIQVVFEYVDSKEKAILLNTLPVYFVHLCPITLCFFDTCPIKFKWTSLSLVLVGEPETLASLLIVCSWSRSYDLIVSSGKSDPGEVSLMVSISQNGAESLAPRKSDSTVIETGWKYLTLASS